MDLIARYKELKQELVRRGYGDELKWAAEQRRPPRTPEEFAWETIYVICNSGLKQQVAAGIYRGVRECIEQGGSARGAFENVPKANAIDVVWKNRAALFQRYNEAADKLECLASLPYIGPITKYHLAKNFGMEVVKPDRHLVRIAATHGDIVGPLSKRENCSDMCHRIARATGDGVALVDSVLWRAANLGLI